MFIYSGGTGSTAIIAAAKSCTISMSVDMIEKASSTQAAAKEYTTGRYEWEVSINHLVVAGTTSRPNTEFEGVLKVGTRFLISVVVGTVRKKGYVICTQADISAAIGGLAQGSVKLKGDGAFGIS